MILEEKKNLIVVLEDLDDSRRYYMEVYASPSDCESIAFGNCRSIYPDVKNHRLICVRVTGDL